jgi:hypothetical protein
MANPFVKKCVAPSFVAGRISRRTIGSTGAAGRAVSHGKLVRRGQVNRGDYEVQGLQVTVATVF